MFPWSRRGLLSALALASALALVPGIAGAHGVDGSRFAAPLPLPLLFGGAGATVGLTAVWLSVSERASAPTADRRQWTVQIPSGIATAVRRAAAGLFLVLVAAAVVDGILGRQVPAENLATVFTWSVWFRGLALVAVVAGTPWPALSPWRTVYRGLCRLEGESVAVLGDYPARLGAWPGLAGFLLLIGVVENLTVLPRSPRLTAVLIAVYGLWAVGGAVLFGTDWLRLADPLAAFYRLFGRVAPLSVDRTDGRVELAPRAPWRGCLDPVAGGALAAFVVAMVYTVSFDGFTDTEQFQSLLFAVRDALGTGAVTSVLLYAAGFLGFVATYALTCWLVEHLGAGTGRRWLPAARRFAPTVVPIAAAYEVAHNYPYVLGNLGRLPAVALRPVVHVAAVDSLGWLSLPAFWGSQVALIVLGHVVAVVAAHRVAVDRYGSLPAARRGHIPLVVLMIWYTVLSLWIVSQPVVVG